MKRELKPLLILGVIFGTLALGIVLVLFFGVIDLESQPEKDLAKSRLDFNFSGKICSLVDVNSGRGIIGLEKVVSEKEFCDKHFGKPYVVCIQNEKAELYTSITYLELGDSLVFNPEDKYLYVYRDNTFLRKKFLTVLGTSYGYYKNIEKHSSM